MDYLEGERVSVCLRMSMRTFHRWGSLVFWTLILGWHQKGLNADVKMAKCFNGHASPLGFSKWTCVFRWARLFLGPGEWACEPYFSNPINIDITCSIKLKKIIFNIF